MTDKIDRLGDIMATPEDVEMPEGLHVDEGSIDHDGIDPGPPPAPPVDGDEPTPAARCVEFPLNDYGNGKRLIEHYGQDLIHVARVGWFHWTGMFWKLDPDGIQVRRFAHNLTNLIAEETWHMTLPDAEMGILSAAEAAALELDELGVIPKDRRTDDDLSRMARASRLIADAKDIKDRRDKSIGRRLTHAKNAGNTNGIKNLMTEAATIIARPLEDLDRDPLTINTEGGILRFELVPGEDEGGANPAPPKVVMHRLDHDREYCLSKIMPVDYDPKAKCPRFFEFLEQVQPLPEMRRFLQRWFGYAMTGLTGEQKFAFLYGGGANGKSVLVDLIAKLMGDYAASAKIESITGRNRRGGGDATPDLMPLINARFVRASEPDEGQRLQEGLIKELTGGEPILVRALNENFVTVYPIFKLTISGNHKPEIHGGDDGIWRRVMLVPFEVQIAKEDRIDKKVLDAMLWEERSGILNWLIEGLTEYLKYGLQVPDAVSSATEEYREDSDPMAAFLTQCCWISGDAEHSLKAKDLSEAFAFWMDEGGRGAWKPGTIFKRIKVKAGKWKSPVTGKMFQARKSSESFYDGIVLSEPFKGRFEMHQVSRSGLSQVPRYDDY